MVRMAEELGASSIKFNVMQPTARGEKLHEAQETLNVRRTHRAGAACGGRNWRPRTDLRLFFDYPRLLAPCGVSPAGAGAASAGSWASWASSPADTMPCAASANRCRIWSSARWARTGLESVWRENAILQALRSGLPERLEGICSRCLMKWRCLGSCVAQNYYSTGDLWAPFWFCKQAEEAGLFPPSRLGASPAQSSGHLSRCGD